MIRLLVATILTAWLAFPAMAASLDAAAINNAEYRSKLPSTDEVDATVVKAQVLLDRAQFSPGEIDGKLGENAQKALRAFAEAKGLTAGKALTAEIWTALAETGKDPVITEYTISEADVKGPFLEKLPDENGRHEKPEGSQLHEPARSHRREISHERRIADGSELREEIRPRRRENSRCQRGKQTSQTDRSPGSRSTSHVRPSRRSTRRARWSPSFRRPWEARRSRPQAAAVKVTPPIPTRTIATIPITSSRASNPSGSVHDQAGAE